MKQKRSEEFGTEPIKRLLDRLAVPEAQLVYLSFLFRCQNIRTSPRNWFEGDHFPDCFRITMDDFKAYVIPAVRAFRTNGLAKEFTLNYWEGLISKQHRDGKAANRRGLEAYYRARLCEAGNVTFTDSLPTLFFSYVLVRENKQSDQLTLWCGDNHFKAPLTLTAITDDTFSKLYIRLEPKPKTRSDMLTLRNKIWYLPRFIHNGDVASFSYVVTLPTGDLPKAVWPQPPVRCHKGQICMGYVGDMYVPFNDTFVQALKTVLDTQRIKVADTCWPH